MKFTAIAILLFMTAAPWAVAQDRAYERILLPLILQDVPGAFGTRWSTEVVVRNEGEVEAAVFRQLCAYRCECGGNTCLIFRPTPPHSAVPSTYLGPGDDSGRFPTVMMNISRPEAEDVYFSLRLYEESLRMTEFGIEVPVVREEEFLGRESWLINIPNVATSRVHLRLYGLESPSGEADIRLRIYHGDAVTPSIDRLVRITPWPGAERIPAPGDYDAIVPGYEVVYLTPEIAASAETVRVRIDPVTPELRYWAMASITSNATQNVTLVTPQ